MVTFVFIDSEKYKKDTISYQSRKPPKWVIFLVHHNHLHNHNVDDKAPPGQMGELQQANVGPCLHSRNRHKNVRFVLIIITITIMMVKI